MTDFYKIGDQYIPSTGDKQADFNMLTTTHGLDPIALSDDWKIPGAYSDEEKQLINQYGEKGSDKRIEFEKTPLQHAKDRYRESPEYKQSKSFENAVDKNVLNSMPMAGLNTLAGSMAKGSVPALRSMMNGLTINNYPRILAGTNTLFNDKSYDENKLNTDAMMAVSQEEHPLASIIGNVGGSMVGPQAAIRAPLLAKMGLNSTLPAAASWLKNIAQGATTGAKYAVAEMPNAVLNTLGAQGLSKKSALNALENALIGIPVGGVVGGAINTVGYPITKAAQWVSKQKYPQRAFAATTNQPFENAVDVNEAVTPVDIQMDYRKPDGGKIWGGKVGIRKDVNIAVKSADAATKDILDKSGVTINVNDVEKNLPEKARSVTGGSVTDAYNKKIQGHIDDLKRTFKGTRDVTTQVPNTNRPGLSEFKDMLDDGDLPFANGLDAEDLDNSTLTKAWKATFPETVPKTSKQVHYETDPVSFNEAKSGYGQRFWRNKNSQPDVDPAGTSAGKDFARGMKKTITNGIPSAEDSLSTSSALHILDNALNNQGSSAGKWGFGSIGQAAAAMSAPVAQPAAHGLRTSGKLIEGLYNSDVAGKALKALFPVVTQQYLRSGHGVRWFK